MSKTVKGILALVAAVLLLGAGYGTYAFWSDSEVIGGGTIDSGELSLTGTDPCVWADVSVPAAPVTIPDIGDFVLVPGDTLTCTLTRTVNAEGNNLTATLAADEGSIGGSPELIAEMDFATTITVDGVAKTAITPADNGDAVVATVTLEFPFTPATNASQLKTLNLANLTLTLTQTR